MPTVTALKLNLANGELIGDPAVIKAALNDSLGLTVHALGQITGTVTLDFANGSRQYGYLSGDATIEVTGGSDMDEIEVGIAWTQSTPTLTFGASVKMVDDMSALMPIELTEYRSYSFTLQKRGGYWTLKGPINGPTVENED